MKSIPNSSLKTEYEEILTTEEAAQYLRVSVGSLRNMTSNGLIPYQKLGKRNRYFKEELRNLLLANRRGGSNGNQTRS
jgi:excisionase family DNA binding protein